jgi:Asp-tRNA(Asn)/Glu-tRNA(Gln) amidotransferase C subunit
MRPEEKLQVIEMSDEEFEMMQEQLDDVQRAVERMSRWDSESHRPTLAGCQEEFAQLCRLFAPLKQEISGQRPAEQEEEEQPRENWRLWRGPEETQ